MTPLQNIYSISAVEQDTGLSKDTLRVWERRYGFPQPERDANGDRVYSHDQLSKLRILKRFIDQGYRPSKIIHLDLDALQKLRPEFGSDVALNGIGNEKLEAYLLFCRAHQIVELKHALSQDLLRLGLQQFVLSVIAPLNHMVGDYWRRGVLAVHEEHLYSEAVQNILRGAIFSISQYQTTAHSRPRILLTTFTQEQHGLGLLMAEALFSLAGASCTSLGVQTPIIDIAQAAKLQHADVVALSFSSMINPQHIFEGLSALNAMLPEKTEVWVGGRNALLTRCTLPNVHVLDLTMVSSAIAEWRQRYST